MQGQDVSLYQQFNGRYDFTFIGNTMNISENNVTSSLVTGTSSTATLNLNPGDSILKAYLYWSGSGDGDFEVDLNGTPMLAERTFNHTRLSGNNQTFTYFSAFKDITNFIQTNGNGNYTLSNLDISGFETYHKLISTNYAGWAILIIVENSNFSLNQINVYDGLQGVPNNLSINLTNLVVIDNSNATAGFIAWEGDASLATETFSINGTVISNASNPINNVFNGTNSITGSNVLYNMDLDIYNIENYIQIGNSDIDITLSSSQDFIMINTVVTKLNSQLPDATIVIDATNQACNSNILLVDFTVYNINSTEILPAGTPIAIYANNSFIEYTETITPIPINGSWSDQISLLLPFGLPLNFELEFIVDDDGMGNGIVIEINEDNNSDTALIFQNSSPTFNKLDNLTSCNEGLKKGTFNFSHYEELVKTNQNQVVHFYNSYEDAFNQTNPIINTTNYVANSTPQEIFIRIENENCFAFTSFLLTTRNCPPTVYNYVSGNFDGFNDAFFIDGLRNIFLNFEVRIYNRWGKWLWTGNHSKPDWDGYVENGIDEKYAPAGTYYYVIYLNDPDYHEPLVGYLYLTR